MYRGSLQGVLMARQMSKRLTAGTSEFGWEVRQRDYYGRDADPDSMLANYPMVIVNGDVGIVPLNATHLRYPRSRLMRQGLTRWEGAPQDPLFDPVEYGAILGWAIPEGVSRVLHMRFVVDRTTLARDKLFGFDLVEFEAGGLAVREFVIRDLEAYSNAEEGGLPEPATDLRPNLDPTSLRSGPYEDVAEEPAVSLKDGAFDDEILN